MATPVSNTAIGTPIITATTTTSGTISYPPVSATGPLQRHPMWRLFAGEVNRKKEYGNTNSRTYPARADDNPEFEHPSSLNFLIVKNAMAAGLTRDGAPPSECPYRA
jgi:hypothetical protein